MIMKHLGGNYDLFIKLMFTHTGSLLQGFLFVNDTLVKKNKD